MPPAAAALNFALVPGCGRGSLDDVVSPHNVLLESATEPIAETRQEATESGRAEGVEKQLRYFVHNVGRMLYGTFRQQGFFIGSGVMEVGCKTVIGTRCKQSGRFWGAPGAENILAFRCLHTSRHLDNFWQYRLNQRAALNDPLPLAA